MFTEMVLSQEIEKGDATAAVSSELISESDL